jgi:iron complex outermembrane receptor protein
MLGLPILTHTPAPGAGIVSTIVKLPPNDSYNVSADWQVNPDTLLYVAHRKGYKAGGINNSPGLQAANLTFAPETAKDVELGVKTRFRIGGMSGQLSADAYQLWYDNIKRSTQIPGVASAIVVNGSVAIIRGLEFDGTLYPTEWFRISANVNYSDAWYTKWMENSTCAAQYWRPQCTSPAQAIVIDHANGSLQIHNLAGGVASNIAFQPDRFPYPGLEWSIQPALLLKPWLKEDVTISSNIHYIGPWNDASQSAVYSTFAGVPPLTVKTPYGTITNPFLIPAVTLIDLRADWRNIRGTKMSLGLSVTNVSDQLYRLNGSSGFIISGSQYVTNGVPRTWFAEMRYDF